MTPVLWFSRLATPALLRFPAVPLPRQTLHPDSNQLPGASVLSGLANGLDGWALLAAMVGLVIGSVIWAFGHYSHNFQQAYNGRRGVMVCALAAVLIGGAPHIIDFFVGKGAGIAS